MIYFIDIDETICKSPNTGEYDKARPILSAIREVNRLYDEGHSITMWTARGALSSIDWTEVTERQLKIWGVKYHNLRFDKPVYDVFIDDKNINSNDWHNSIKKD